MSKSMSNNHIYTFTFAWGRTHMHNHYFSYVLCLMSVMRVCTCCVEWILHMLSFSFFFLSFLLPLFRLFYRIVWWSKSLFHVTHIAEKCLPMCVPNVKKIKQNATYDARSLFFRPLSIWFRIWIVRLLSMMTINIIIIVDCCWCNQLFQYVLFGSFTFMDRNSLIFYCAPVLFFFLCINIDVFGFQLPCRSSSVNNGNHSIISRFIVFFPNSKDMYVKIILMRICLILRIFISFFILFFFSFLNKKFDTLFTVHFQHHSWSSIHSYSNLHLLAFQIMPFLTWTDKTEDKWTKVCLCMRPIHHGLHYGYVPWKIFSAQLVRFNPAFLGNQN